MLDFGQFGVDLDNHVLDIDVRRQHQIFARRSCSLMADFLGAACLRGELG